MKAVIFRSYGAPDDVLQLVDADERAMAADEVLVQVDASVGQPRRLAPRSRHPTNVAPESRLPDTREAAAPVGERRGFRSRQVSEWRCAR